MMNLNKLTIVIVIGVSFILSSVIMFLAGRILWDRNKVFHKNWIEAAKMTGGRIEGSKGLIYRRDIGILGTLKDYSFHLEQHSRRYGKRTLLSITLTHPVNFVLRKRSTLSRKGFLNDFDVLKNYEIFSSQEVLNSETIAMLQNMVGHFNDVAVKTKGNILVIEIPRSLKEVQDILTFVQDCIKLAEVFEK